eukprot:5781242-Pleurochrysis_carterae.AAC.1
MRQSALTTHAARRLNTARGKAAEQSTRRSISIKSSSWPIQKLDRSNGQGDCSVCRVFSDA